MVVVLFAWQGCSEQALSKKIDFDLDQPDRTIELPKALTEISGLSYHGGYLYMIQDEDGDVFRMIPDKPDDIKREKFKDKGDFEGIEYVEGKLYMMLSNGTVYACDVDDIDKDKVKKYETQFKAKDNIEGFGYDPVTRDLLIGTKRVDSKKNRALYRIPVDNLESEPNKFFEIDPAKLKEKLFKNAQSKLERVAWQAAFIDYSFHPSGIAIDPANRDIYVLSSPEPQLLVLDHKYAIKSLRPLDSKKIKQPEGICFDSLGNLYISSEGRSGKANLFIFNRK